MKTSKNRFADRADAGQWLAARLSAMGLDKPVVYALPRGGVPVALEIARTLGSPLDLIMVRKIGAPGAPEVALGAVVDGATPQTVINKEVRRRSGAVDGYLERVRALELRELERRRSLYLDDRAQVSPAGRTAISMVTQVANARGSHGQLGSGRSNQQRHMRQSQLLDLRGPGAHSKAGTSRMSRAGAIGMPTVALFKGRWVVEPYCSSSQRRWNVRPRFRWLKTRCLSDWMSLLRRAGWKVMADDHQCAG